MAKKKPRTTRATRKPRVHKNLAGLEVSIDPFGEIKSSMNIEKINQFLDEHVEDKKLTEQREHDRQKQKKGSKEK
jgi:hypothetical protein